MVTDQEAAGASANGQQPGQAAPEVIEGATPTKWGEGEPVPAEELRGMGYTDFAPFKPFVSEHLVTIETHTFGYGRTLIAHKADANKGEVVFTAGEMILELSPHFKREPDQHTLRVDADLHQFNILGEQDLENYVSHSCSPTCRWSWDSMSALRIPLLAVHDIHQDEPITYNYLTTDEGRKPGEIKGEDDFLCTCGSENCRGLIVGFRQLSLEEMRELAPFISPYLRGILREKEAAQLRVTQSSDDAAR